MSNYIERQTVEYELSELPFDRDGKLKIIDVSQVRLCFAHKKYPFDYGYLAYSSSKLKDKCNSCNTIRLVKKESLSYERLPLLESYLESVFIDYKTGINRETTILTKLKDSIKFVIYCNNNEKHKAFQTLKSTQNALREYLEYLRHKIKVNLLSLNTATNMQNYAIEMVAAMYGIQITDVSNGIRLLVRKNTVKINTEAPLEHDVQKILKLCDCLFNQITDFVLNNKKYPFQLQLPTEKAWVVPHFDDFIVTLATQSQFDKKKSKSAWNFKTGKLYSPEEIAYRYKVDKICKAKLTIKKSEGFLYQANSNNRDKKRLRLAELSKDAFMILFLAHVAPNFEQFRQLKGWTGQYNIGIEYQGFRTIKWRAEGKVVEFLIGLNFLPSFKKYLKLREYLLLEHPKFDYLFFAFNGRLSKPKQVALGAQSEFYDRIRKRIDPSINNVHSRHWRVVKGNYIINKTGDISLVAQALQNKEETALKKYINGNEVKASEELGLFFERLNKRIYKPTPVGHCNIQGNLQPNNNELGFIPDCKKLQGCLFCSQYAIHADETDIRKLYSLTYVMRETISLSTSEDHHMKLFGAVYDRAALILKIMSSKSEKLSELVKIVKKDVEDNENLDSYWENKLNTLISLGVI